MCCILLMVIRLTGGSRSVLRGSQGICDHFPREPWIHCVMATLKYTYFLNERNDVLLKVIEELL